MQAEPASTSSTQAEDKIEVCPFSEMDIAVAIVYLKAHARHHGIDGTPIAVLLSPFAQGEGWRKAALEFLTENAEKRARGEPIVLTRRSWGTAGMMKDASEYLGYKPPY